MIHKISVTISITNNFHECKYVTVKRVNNCIVYNLEIFKPKDERMKLNEKLNTEHKYQRRLSTERFRNLNTYYDN